LLCGQRHFDGLATLWLLRRILDLNASLVISFSCKHYVVATPDSNCGSQHAMLTVSLSMAIEVDDDSNQ
jgi:hypothetical protein